MMSLVFKKNLLHFGAKHETKESMELQKTKEVRMYLFFSENRGMACNCFFFLDFASITIESLAFTWKASFHGNVNFRFCDFLLVIFSIMKSILKVVTSWRVRGRTRFWMYLLNGRSFRHKTCSAIKYSYGQYFEEIFCMIWRSGS